MASNRLYPSLAAYVCAIALTAVYAFGQVKAGPVLAPDPAAATAEVQKAYDKWKTSYVTDKNAGGHLRVRRLENQADTVSEGIGYGMLLAACMDDKATLDGLWAYAKSHPDPNNLMHWHISADNKVLNENAATDADQDMAWALVVADKKWGGYKKDAEEILEAMMVNEVEAETNVLKPGDFFGGSNMTNPSYFAPGFYRAFANYTGEKRWNAVADSCYTIMENVGKKSGTNTGLMPDWCDAQGEAVSGHSYDCLYDACRAPWRIATDAALYNVPKAIAHVEKVNAFFKGIGPANIKDGYKLDGKLKGQWHNASMLAPACAAAMLSKDAEYKKAMWDELVKLPNENYFNDTLKVMSLVLAAGKMPAI